MRGSATHPERRLCYPACLPLLGPWVPWLQKSTEGPSSIDIGTRRPLRLPLLLPICHLVSAQGCPSPGVQHATQHGTATYEDWRGLRQYLTSSPASPTSGDLLFHSDREPFPFPDNSPHPSFCTPVLPSQSLPGIHPHSLPSSDTAHRGLQGLS